ncbi:nucleoside triphosphate pyrophosphohydrolase [Anthocerotibacter panamensis]|uniref:nucleoside triphosphate pyrophosphohydrolase n=1 Tax=Anthocerotibacter panamensis TaxID=2857077 RepID=UPI001C4044F3|nr:nucleoside triphosphate pyrophosphohydrolase [Anthocerotibacter panamensis]
MSAPSDPTAIQTFLDTVARLREDCPWDREQTPQTLCPYILEEAAELVDAIESGNSDAVLEELGDLLLQVVLQTQIYSEQGTFDFAQVCARINAKMIHRHPHVFGTTTVTSSAEVAQNWEVLKAQEKAPQALSEKLHSLPKHLSGLTTAHKISNKVAQIGFEWPDLAGVLAKLQEELAELEQALATETTERQAEELGDVLFTLVNVARWQGFDSETALRQTNRRFLQRFALVEKLADRPLSTYTLAQLETLWQQAKQHAARQVKEI